MFPILTIASGLIVASPLIVAKKPNAKEIFARIAPYQGVLGVGVLALGILWLIRWLPLMGASIGSIHGLIVLGMIAANITLGFLLGFGLLSGILAKNPTAKAKSQEIIAKLTAIQVPLGVTAVGLGVASYVV